jgi:hypothetical protein
MIHARNEHGRAHWIALAAIVALLAGLAAWYTLARPPRRETPAAMTAPPATAAPDVNLNPDERVVQQALERAKTSDDSVAIKQRWVEEVRDVDLALLSAPRREIFVRFANAERCTCGCGFTLAACRSYDSECEVSLPRIRSLFDSVRAGLITRTSGIRRRPA